MANVCKQGDTISGTCSAHTPPIPFTGVWGPGSAILTIGGLSVIRIGDTCISSCGHTIKAVGGSTIVKNSGVGLHRNGDAVIIVEGGSGTSTSGSSIVNAI